MHVISFSLGKEILRKGSREYERMQLYAKHLEELHIIVLARGGTRAHYVDGNLHVYDVGTRTRFGAFLTGFMLAKLILQGAFKDEKWVVTSQDPLLVGLFGLLIAKRVGVPHIVQLHGDIFGKYGYATWKQHIAKFVIGKSDRVRVVSERIKRSLIARGISEMKINVLPIRPELEKFLAVEGNPEGDVVRIVTVSRLAPEKHIEMLLAAFTVVQKTYPRTHLEIAGAGPEEGKLKRFVSAHALESAVTFTPWTDDVPSIMARSNIFAFASKHEGYALVLLEALAAGVPVVTTDVGLVGDVVSSGEHGEVVPVGDTESFTAALMRLVEDVSLRNTYAQNGKMLARALAETSEETYAEAWVAALAV